MSENKKEDIYNAKEILEILDDVEEKEEEIWMLECLNENGDNIKKLKSNSFNLMKKAIELKEELIKNIKEEINKKKSLSINELLELKLKIFSIIRLNKKVIEHNSGLIKKIEIKQITEDKKEKLEKCKKFTYETSVEMKNMEEEIAKIHLIIENKIFEKVTEEIDKEVCKTDQNKIIEEKIKNIEEKIRWIEIDLLYCDRFNRCNYSK